MKNAATYIEIAELMEKSGLACATKAEMDAALSATVDAVDAVRHIETWREIRRANAATLAAPVSSGNLATFWAEMSAALTPSDAAPVLSIKTAQDYVVAHFAKCGETIDLANTYWSEPDFVQVNFTLNGRLDCFTVWLEPCGNDGKPFLYGEW